VEGHQGCRARKVIADARDHSDFLSRLVRKSYELSARNPIPDPGKRKIDRVGLLKQLIQSSIQVITLNELHVDSPGEIPFAVPLQNSFSYISVFKEES